MGGFNRRFIFHRDNRLERHLVFGGDDGCNLGADYFAQRPVVEGAIYEFIAILLCRGCGAFCGDLFLYGYREGSRLAYYTRLIRGGRGIIRQGEPPIYFVKTAPAGNRGGVFYFKFNLLDYFLPYGFMGSVSSILLGRYDMTETGEIGERKLTPRELVLQKYPTARVEDDGQSVDIIFTEKITDKCPHCGQDWTHYKFNPLKNPIGRAGNEHAAWDDAAKSLD